MDFYSDYTIIFAIFICVFGFAFHFLYTKQRTKQNGIVLPPSPSPSLPIFGNLFSVDSSALHVSLSELAKRHGPIMLLKLGQLTTVVFSSAEVAKEALEKHDLAFSVRTVLDAVDTLNHKDYSFIFLPPSLKWRNLRKICNSHIFSTRKVDDSQSIRASKVKDLHDFVEKFANAGMVVDIGLAGFSTVLNVLSTTFFSLDLGDPTSEFSSKFKKTFRGIIEELGKPNIADFFPIFKNIDIQGIKRRGTVLVQNMLDLFNTIIEERLRDRSSPNYLRHNDVLDAWLDMNAVDAEYIEPAFAIPHLLFDLIVAGTDTTSNTFEWAMAELLRNPNKLKTLQLEIQEIAGKGKIVEEGHITHLPYLQAIVKETLRLHPPAPIPVPRKVLKDINMFGYTIPANSMVLFNVGAIGRDPNIWDNPDKFEPERFLGSEIDVKGRDFELIPFGAGRRICPGMTLAIRILPLMIATLVHDFNWEFEEGVTPQNLNMDEKCGFTVEKAHRLRAIPVPC